ncbi:MAG: hypothetical protein H7099_12560 [Gemmatimonadaceae bacterium]|nr:hypothetical protein [Gemmatimonadaceae bacterium]
MTFNPVESGGRPQHSLHCCPELLHFHALHHHFEALDEGGRVQRIEIRDMPQGWTRVGETPAGDRR